MSRSKRQRTNLCPESGLLTMLTDADLLKTSDFQYLIDISVVPGFIFQLETNPLILPQIAHNFGLTLPLNPDEPVIKHWYDLVHEHAYRHPSALTQSRNYMSHRAFLYLDIFYGQCKYLDNTRDNRPEFLFNYRLDPDTKCGLIYKMRDRGVYNIPDDVKNQEYWLHLASLADQLNRSCLLIFFSAKTLFSCAIHLGSIFLINVFCEKYLPTMIADMGHTAKIDHFIYLISHAMLNTHSQISVILLHAFINYMRTQAMFQMSTEFMEIYDRARSCQNLDVIKTIQTEIFLPEINFYDFASSNPMQPYVEKVNNGVIRQHLIDIMSFDLHKGADNILDKPPTLLAKCVSTETIIDILNKFASASNRKSHSLLIKALIKVITDQAKLVEIAQAVGFIGFIHAAYTLCRPLLARSLAWNLAAKEDLIDDPLGYLTSTRVYAIRYNDFEIYNILLNLSKIERPIKELAKDMVEAASLGRFDIYRLIRRRMGNTVVASPETLSDTRAHTNGFIELATYPFL